MKYEPRQPLDKCPHCQVKVIWALSDGAVVYDCGKGITNCPIRFSERVAFPEGELNFYNGILFYYGFTVGGIHAVIDYGGDGRLPQRKTPRLIIHPKYIGGNLSGGAIIIDQVPDIDWSNLELLANKLKVLTTFS